MRVRRFLLIVLFADLMAVSARIAIPLPPVTLTLQTAVALLAGALLGARGGFLCQALYLAMGLAGLPVFSAGGGIGYVLRPTFGYLIGFCGGAWLTGRLLESREAPGRWATLGAMAAGLVVIYACGLGYLWLNLRYIQNATPRGAEIMRAWVLMPLPGDLIKLGVAASLYRSLRPVLVRFGN